MSSADVPDPAGLGPVRGGQGRRRVRAGHSVRRTPGASTVPQGRLARTCRHRGGCREPVRRQVPEGGGMANTMQALPEEWLPASGVRALVDGLRATRPRLHTGRPTPAPGGLPSAPRLSGLGGPTPMAGRDHGYTQPPKGLASSRTPPPASRRAAALPHPGDARWSGLTGSSTPAATRLRPTGPPARVPAGRLRRRSARPRTCP
jgi:hypothetical protein